MTVVKPSPSRKLDSEPLPGPRGEQSPVQARSAFAIEVPFSPEALDIIRERWLQRLIDVMGNPHLQPGVISDIFADLEALSKTRPKL